MVKNIVGPVEQTTAKSTQAEKLPVAKFHPLIEALTKKWRLDSEHIDYHWVSYFLTERLDVLNRLFGGKEDCFDKLQGKRILDLGCGSCDTYDNSVGFVMYRMFEPWLCRALHELGASPVGIEMYSLDNEPFNYHLVDLSLKGALDFLPTGFFDVIISHSLLGDGRLSVSPSLRRKVGIREIDVKVKEMREEFMQQASRLLKESGVFLFENEHLMKRNDKFEPISR